MLIDRLESMAQFETVRPDWERVYASDPNADFFRSWAWMRAWLEDTLLEWFVLAVRPDASSPYSAFLALAGEEKTAKRMTVARDLHAAGNRISDYTGFLSEPEAAEASVRALAGYIRDRTEWDRLHFMDVLDPRMDIFLEEFTGRRYTVEKVEELPCAYIDLPGSWDSFLKDSLAKKARQNLRRAMRRIEGLEGFRSALVDQDTFDDYVGIVLDLWQSRWGKKSEGALRTFRNMFRACHENGSLYLEVLWQGENPIGGRLGFIDRVRGTFLGYMNCFNEEFGNLSPGTALVGYSVRYAIENGLGRYDFLRGGEEYKSSFGADERMNRSYVITRQGFGSRARRLAGRLAGV